MDGRRAHREKPVLVTIPEKFTGGGSPWAATRLLRVVCEQAHFDQHSRDCVWSGQSEPRLRASTHAEGASGARGGARTMVVRKAGDCQQIPLFDSTIAVAARP
jgi:hypothetical protein